jgi:preprotein translocase subunit SecD
MKTKVLVLSLITAAVINIPASFAKNFKSLKAEKKSTDERFEIYPVKVSKNSSKECLDFDGRCLLPLTKKPAVVIENFEYNSFSDNGAGLELHVDEKTSKMLEAATKKYQNSRLAFMYKGKVLSAPVVKEVINGKHFNITFNDAKVYESVVESLAN